LLLPDSVGGTTAKPIHGGGATTTFRCMSSSSWPGVPLVVVVQSFVAVLGVVVHHQEEDGGLVELASAAACSSSEGEWIPSSPRNSATATSQHRLGKAVGIAATRKKCPRWDARLPNVGQRTPPRVATNNFGEHGASPYIQFELDFIDALTITHFLT
jgi:hypothetical protein